MSRFLFYPHVRGAISRLPEHYKRRYLKSRLSPPIKYIQESTEPWKRAASDNALHPSEAFEVAPNVLFPEESQRALWGGEGIVRGFIELRRTHTRCPKTWGPDLRQHMFYSEILERWMTILVSVTALKQIENLKGIDNYILETPENELSSRLAMYMKREMLLRISSDEFQRGNPDLVKKYSKFAIPREEAEWVGLSLEEAIKKQLKLEHEQARIEAETPKKYIYAQALLEQLERPTESTSESIPDEPEQKPGLTSSIRQSIGRFFQGSKSKNI
ncbi:unnamed protein product [Dibothriocephalus latus]|uniref:Large ribosomal subunit protein bL28m n=1 Tax=Dibothriocephalus latus TaxID=60516 RepID=A0A3P7KXY5_DIBLA|nr:unnamed protein product [Dibothriocephalus latus]